MQLCIVLLLAACCYVSSQDSAPTPGQPKAISNDLDPSEIRNDESTSAFAVAAVIDLAITAAYFVLFCILRPRFGWLYNPRNLSESKVEGAAAPLSRGIVGWLPTLLRLSDEELFRTTGLDALMYVRFFKLGVEIFAIATFLGIILLIINVTATNNVTGIGVASLANIAPNDPRLAAHLIAAYILTFSVFWLLKRNYIIYTRFRLPFLRGEGMGGDSLFTRSLAVYHIPTQYRTQEKLFDYFRGIWGDRVESVAVTCKVSEVEKTIKKRDSALSSLEHAVAAGKDGKVQQHRPKKCCGPKVDSVEYYTKELEQLNQKVVSEQTKAMQGPKFPVGFATFATEFDAHSMVRNKMSAYKPIELKHAPEPRDVLWDNCRHGEKERVIRYLIAKVMVIALVLFWTIPVTFVASLTTMANLTKWLPFLAPILNFSPTLQGFIQGFLPTLALTIFMILLPRILAAIANFEGKIAISWVEMSVMKNFTLFSIIDIFLATTLAGSLLGVVQNGLGSPLTLVNLLGQSLPGFSTFFAAYILLKTAGLPQQMCNLVGLVLGFIRKKRAKTPREIQSAENPGPISYGVDYSSNLLVLIIGLAYTVIAPIVPFCALLFFVVGYVAGKYQAVYVNVAVYESGGLFWPLVHNRILAGLIVAQLTIIAIFGLKQAPIVAALSVPLIFFTVLFYCVVEKKYRPRTESLPIEEARSTAQQPPRPISVYQPSPLLEGGFVTNLFFPKRTTAFNPEDVSPLLEAEPNHAPGTAKEPEGVALDILPPNEGMKDRVAPVYSGSAGEETLPPKNANLTPSNNQGRQDRDQGRQEERQDRDQGRYGGQDRDQGRYQDRDQGRYQGGQDQDQGRYQDRDQGRYQGQDRDQGRYQGGQDRDQGRYQDRDQGRYQGQDRDQERQDPNQATFTSLRYA